MHHKLQPSTLENNGLNSVVRENPQTSNSPIASNDAGPEHTSPTANFTSEIASTENPQLVETAAASSAPTQSQSDSAPESCGEAEDFIPSDRTPSPSTCAQDVRPDPRSVPDQPRCEVARSAGYDPTGEHAVACGAFAEVVCEYCGPMCASCAEETFCFYGEHKLTQLPDDGPLPLARKRRPPVNEVVYVEIKCPKCHRVRLALPKKHRAKGVRKCPVCKTKAPAEYLAHGFTRRRLPYHEVFTTEKELPEGVEFKRRTPWDRRPNWWVEE